MNTSKLNQVKEDLKEGYNEFKGHKGNTCYQFLDKAVDELNYCQYKLEKEIKKNPIEATAVAFGVGLLLGLFLLPRKKGK